MEPFRLIWPPIEIHCPGDSCKRLSFADPSREGFSARSKGGHVSFINYSCRNCRQLLKTFALEIDHFAGSVAFAIKVGELPLFGPIIPSELLALLGDEAMLFEKGHRAESQGLGLAAFTYYRRVVEAQRTRLFDEIIAVAEHIRADAKLIERLKTLRAHWRFQQSVDEIKDCMPQMLLIEGENPLELLHPVLCDSIHDRSDDEALEIAGEIRLILVSLAERLALARRQSDELKSAVQRLVARKEQRGKRIPIGVMGSQQAPPPDAGTRA